ncbi:hypothetical protein C0992_004579 [Termitomyces sp. T32_za158]|nr:hypothetical protein C0992_004579 [Termitomyces sp. T32_za158]
MTLLSAYYSYRVVQIKKEAGGWWNMALGRRSSMSMGHDEASSTSFSHIRRGKAAAASTHDDGESVEDKINALARALGMPSKDLASAIAVAVREYVPPASLSSIAGKASGTAVSAMLQEGKEGKSAQADSQSTGIIGDVVGGMDTFVGMDEPV